MIAVIAVVTSLAGRLCRTEAGIRTESARALQQQLRWGLAENSPLRASERRVGTPNSPFRTSDRWVGAMNSLFRRTGDTFHRARARDRHPIDRECLVELALSSSFNRDQPWFASALAPSSESSAPSPGPASTPASCHVQNVPTPAQLSPAGSVPAMHHRLSSDPIMTSCPDSS